MRRTSPRLTAAASLGPLLLGAPLVFGLGVAPARAAASEAGPHTSLVSVGLHSAGAAGQSYAPAISADGRYVAFDSDADNLVSGDRHLTAISCPIAPVLTPREFRDRLTEPPSIPDRGG